MSSRKYGYTFEKEIRDSLLWLQREGRHFWFDKLVDTHAFDGIFRMFRGLLFKVSKNEPLKEEIERGGHRIGELFAIVNQGLKMTLPKVPADFHVICNGKVTFFECKSSKNRPSYRVMSLITDYQIQEARKIITYGGGRYYFLICNRVKMRGHYVLAIPALKMMAARAKCLNEDRLSLKWEELMNFADEILHETKRVWDKEILWSLIDW